MSFLARISARTAPVRSGAPAAMPKGLKTRQGPAISRMEAGQEGEEKLTPARTVRRQEEEELEAQRQTDSEEDAEMAPMRRQASEEEEEELAPLRRQEEEELAPLRRQEEEEEEEAVAPLRRQEEEEEELQARRTITRQEEEEEELAPLRRQEEEEEEELQAMRAIARQEEVPLNDTEQAAPPPAQSELEPNPSAVPPETAGEEEPSDLQALHRDVVSAPPPGPARPDDAAGHMSADAGYADSLSPPTPLGDDYSHGFDFANAPPQSTRIDDSRPSVVIDQLDVLIHEPVQAERTAPRRSRDTAMRARYLRRL